MSEPEIIAYGRRCIKEYEVEEFKASLSRSFSKRCADFIILYSSPVGQKFLSACAAWAIDKGWLYHDKDEDTGQELISSFRLTDNGKRALLG